MVAIVALATSMAVGPHAAALASTNSDDVAVAGTATSSDAPTWLSTLPTRTSVGHGWTATPGKWFGLRAYGDVHDATVHGGKSGAIRAQVRDVTITNSLLGGANDGLKPYHDTTLRDSVVTLSYGEGAHGDHVQATGDDGLTLERVRLIASNQQGATDKGWNAAIFIQSGSTDWTIRDVHVQAGDARTAIRSHFPVRLNSGRGVVDGLVVDRATMKGDTPVHVADGVRIDVWRDVWIRELDGSFTPVARP